MIVDVRDDKDFNVCVILHTRSLPLSLSLLFPSTTCHTIYDTIMKVMADMKWQRVLLHVRGVILSFVSVVLRNFLCTFSFSFFFVRFLFLSPSVKQKDAPEIPIPTPSFKSNPFMHFFALFPCHRGLSLNGSHSKAEGASDVRWHVVLQTTTCCGRTIPSQ